MIKSANDIPHLAAKEGQVSPETTVTVVQSEREVNFRFLAVDSAVLLLWVEVVLFVVGITGIETLTAIHGVDSVRRETLATLPSFHNMLHKGNVTSHACDDSKRVP